MSAYLIWLDLKCDIQLKWCAALSRCTLYPRGRIRAILRIFYLFIFLIPTPDTLQRQKRRSQTLTVKESNTSTSKWTGTTTTSAGRRTPCQKSTRTATKKESTALVRCTSIKSTWRRFPNKVRTHVWESAWRSHTQHSSFLSIGTGQVRQLKN